MGKFHQVAITGVLALAIGITLALVIELLLKLELELILVVELVRGLCNKLLYINDPHLSLLQYPTPPQKLPIELVIALDICNKLH